MASRASIFGTRPTTSARPEPLIPADYRPPRDAFQESKEVHAVWNILSTKGVHFTMGWAARSVKHEMRTGLQILVGFGLISFPSCTALAQSYLQNRPPGIETEPGSLRLAILQKTAG